MTKVGLNRTHKKGHGGSMIGTIYSALLFD